MLRPTLPATLVILWALCAPSHLIAAETADTTANQTAVTPAAPDATLLATATAERERQAALVAQLQNQPTPDITALGSALLALGESLQVLGQHEEAIAAFEQALQLRRVNFGLYDVAQLPVLQALLESHTALAAWEEVDALHHQRHYIAAKQLGAGADLRVDTLVQLGEWKRQASAAALLDANQLDVADTLQLYRHEIEQAQRLDEAQRNPLQLATLYLDLAKTELMEANQLWERPIVDFDPSGSPSQTQMRCFAVRLADGRVQQICESVEVPNINYYLEPNQRKSVGIYRYLESIQAAVMDAYTVLQDDEQPSDRRDALLAQVQQLAADYNAFVAKAQLQTGTRITP